MIDLTLSEFLDYINSLQLRTLIYYYFSLYVFTNLASRALKFEIKINTLELGHKFILTLILISLFHVILSIRQDMLPVQDLHTSLIEVAIFFIILLYVIGRWIISTNGILQYLSTQSLLQNKKLTESTLAEDNKKRIADIEKNRESLESSHPGLDFTELLKQNKIINYELVKNAAEQKATELRDHWVFLLSDFYILFFLLYNSAIQSTITKLALLGTLILFIHPRIKILYNSYKADAKYEIPIKG